MNKRLIFAIVVFIVVLIAGIVSASSQSYTMSWFINAQTIGKTLWLNFTEADNWLGEKPENICFGLANGSVCLGTNATHLDMQNNSIYNTYETNTTIVNADYYCHINGTCYNITDLIEDNVGGGGSGTGDGNITGSGIESYVPIYHNDTDLTTAPVTQFYFDGVGWVVRG